MTLLHAESALVDTSALRQATIEVSADDWEALPVPAYGIERIYEMTVRLTTWSQVRHWTFWPVDGGMPPQRALVENGCLLLWTTRPCDGRLEIEGVA